MPIPQLFIGLFTEGTTDVRFLRDIVKRTFDDMSFECLGQIEIADIQAVKIEKLSFVEDVINASRKGVNDFGIAILCVHADADDSNDKTVYRYKMNPALSEIEKQDDDVCKIIVPIVPVQMTEAWILADKNLLKKEIGTNKTDRELGIYREPEQYSDPKTTIEDAIRIAQRERPKRHRRELTIADLYMSIGQSVSIGKLKQLSSYNKFQDNIRRALGKLNYLY